MAKRYILEHESELNKIRQDNHLTWIELSKHVGINYKSLRSLSIGITSPIDRKGQIREYVKTLCQVLGVELEELFPIYFCKFQRLHNPECVGYGINYIIDEREDNDPAIAYEHKNLCQFALKKLKEISSSKQENTILKYCLYDYDAQKIGDLDNVNIKTIYLRISKTLQRLRKHIQYQEVKELKTVQEMYNQTKELKEENKILHKHIQELLDMDQEKIGPIKEFQDALRIYVKASNRFQKYGGRISYEMLEDARIKINNIMKKLYV